MNSDAVQASNNTRRRDDHHFAPTCILTTTHLILHINIVAPAPETPSSSHNLLFSSQLREGEKSRGENKMCNRLKTLHSVCGHIVAQPINACDTDVAATGHVNVNVSENSNSSIKSPPPPTTPPWRPSSFVRYFLSDSEIQRLRAPVEEKRRNARAPVKRQRQQSAATTAAAHRESPASASKAAQEHKGNREAISPPSGVIKTLLHRQQIQIVSSRENDNVHDLIDIYVYGPASSKAT
ncbi:uncharacterized protein B0T23DRAFT_428257 [Neurospora hispaniola]|uniref:Uncharacterized protein n=1 Tax=Neurospora hispaniola TaxID=588809 RepID=A0AAJ0IB63_9PEZI|nr:hypothetical protein B0T23DRAFT_428257 [Neurospora hispaniola]